MQVKPNRRLTRGALALCGVLLASLACSLQSPNLAPATPISAPATQPNQNPNLPPPTDNTVPAAPPVIEPGATQNNPSSNSGSTPLEILSPLEGATVNTARLEVRGVALPGAVVSVNDEILIADSNGQFSTFVSLEVGLNLIEIIASDALGNEAVLELTVYYEAS